MLRDGSILNVRGVRQEDRIGLMDFFNNLSKESVYFRFFGIGISPENAVEAMMPAQDRYALIALREEKIVAHAAYYIKSPVQAEIGLVIADALRQKGLGTILLGQLSKVASRSGIATFEAIVAPENYQIIEVVRSLGFPIAQEIVPGAIRIVYPTSLLQESIDLFESREAIAALTAVRSFFTPKGVAVVGASRQKDAIGGRLFANLVDGDFNGVVYPVNIKSGVVQSIVAYPSIRDCPGPVDLALIAVPASAVLECARECARRGVRSLVVISAGFAEAGMEGSKIQEELVKICRGSGMRVIGPNCMGIVNTDPNVNLNAQFSPLKPIRGRIGFLSQSGALGIAVIDLANKLGLGMSTFASVGNKADISGNDLIQYWEADENTDVILLYLESFGNPRKFSRIARRVTKKKPIVVVKSGRSSAGFRATQSHTGAILAASDVTVDALFKQTGVIRTDTLEEMFDVAALLSTQPVPRGNRVAIITNAGGAGILAADSCEVLGLRVPELSQETQNVLRGFLPADAGLRNPVDMIASATPRDYSETMRVVAKDPNVDALLVIFIPPIAVKPEQVAREILKVKEELGQTLPVLSTFMASQGVATLLSDGSTRIPSYPFPESAVRALAHAASYRAWLQRPEEKTPTFNDIMKGEAAAIVANALKQGDRWLTQEESEKLLRCYGIPLVKTIQAGTPEEAGRAAEQLGGKVVLKATAPGLVHKTEVGGVKLSLGGSNEVVNAAQKMSKELASMNFKVSGFLVQQMITDSVEMFVGVTHDPYFGSVVAAGAGGIFVEILKDVSVRLTPVTANDADDMVRSLKTFPMLLNFRGSAAADVRSFEELITRIGCLAEEIPEVVELDLNPVMVFRGEKGACAVDYRIRVAKTPPPIPLGAKR